VERAHLQEIIKDLHPEGISRSVARVAIETIQNQVARPDFQVLGMNQKVVFLNHQDQEAKSPLVVQRMIQRLHHVVNDHSVVLEEMTIQNQDHPDFQISVMNQKEDFPHEVKSHLDARAEMRVANQNQEPQDSLAIVTIKKEGSQNLQEEGNHLAVRKMIHLLHHVAKDHTVGHAEMMNQNQGHRDFQKIEMIRKKIFQNHQEKANHSVVLVMTEMIALNQEEMMNHPTNHVVESQAFSQN
jgi:hypothetical protein